MSSLTKSELQAVAAALRDHDRFLLVTHENPDGDAFGSILALARALDSLGKQSVLFVGGDSELPLEYEFLGLSVLARELPDDLEQRVLVALDCASEKRIGFDPALLAKAPLTLNVDHHHDNTRFAALNLVVPDASSTGEIVRDVLRELGVPLTREIADALYVALVTDTGRFQYSNTTPKALRLAAELVEAGVDVHGVFQVIYESIAFKKLKLLGRLLDHAQVYEDDRLVISYILRDDFAELGVGEEYAENMINYLRAVDGTEMAATIREPPEPGDAARRISLRASHDELDVSAIARKRGGGGHRQAAGFSSTDSIAEIIEFIRSEFAAASSAVGKPS
jgi:bifunctional oligoribonuclease and PAP phosphatase NrnA